MFLRVLTYVHALCLLMLYLRMVILTCVYAYSYASATNALQGREPAAGHRSSQGGTGGGRKGRGGGCNAAAERAERQSDFTKGDQLHERSRFTNARTVPRRAGARPQGTVDSANLVDLVNFVDLVHSVDLVNPVDLVKSTGWTL